MYLGVKTRWKGFFFSPVFLALVLFLGIGVAFSAVAVLDGASS